MKSLFLLIVVLLFFVLLAVVLLFFIYNRLKTLIKVDEYDGEFLEDEEVEDNPNR